MEKPILKPLDVIVVDGLWYMPHHWLIRWRTLDPGVHCVTVMNEQGYIWNPIFSGIKSGNNDEHGHINFYQGRTLSVHRYKGQIDHAAILAWCETTANTSQGYDFIGQWLLGFVCGITTKNNVNDETRWTCAEFPYWAFQYNKCELTTREESLPMPRLFRYSDHFETVFEGVW
jgi:hypothetical protein